MTSAPYLDPVASALERLAWEVSRGKIAGIAIVGIRKDGSAVSHMRLPDSRDHATGMMGGLALAAFMTARKAIYDRIPATSEDPGVNVGCLLAGAGIVLALFAAIVIWGVIDDARRTMEGY